MDTQGTQILALQVDLRNYEMNQKVWISMASRRINVFNKETQRLIRYAEENIKEETDE